MEHPYNELRKKDYKKFVESKGNFDYLSWAKCLDMVKQIDPFLRYELVDLIECGQSKLVHARLYYRHTPQEESETEDSQAYIHDEYLAVRDYRNKAIANPDSAQVENTFRRAVAKAISMCFGYGINLWINEDIRDLDYVPETNNGVMPEKGKMTVDQRVKLDRLSRHKLLSDEETDKIKSVMKDTSKTEVEIDETMAKVIKTIEQRRTSKDGTNK